MIGWNAIGDAPDAWTCEHRQTPFDAQCGVGFWRHYVARSVTLGVRTDTPTPDEGDNDVIEKHVTAAPRRRIVRYVMNRGGKVTGSAPAATCFERPGEFEPSALVRNSSAQAYALPTERHSEATVDPLRDLMRRYAEGDDEVFKQLYELLSPHLYRLCKRLTRQPSEADDVFQETFLRLHRARATYLPGANVLHWAFAIARSAHLDRLRYWRRRPEALGAAADTAEDERLCADQQYGPEAQAQARDLLAIVTTALNKMSEKNRHAYILLREEGLSVDEAAAVLGTTSTVVKQRAHRAYEQLRTALRAAK